MEALEIKPIKIENISLPFLSTSLIQHWILSKEAEEISLIICEVFDLYLGVDEQERKFLDHSKILNLIFLILKNLKFDDSSLRLQSIKLLSILAEDHIDVFVFVNQQIFICLQSFLQDLSRVIRLASLKLAIQLVVKLPIEILSNSILGLIESTYTYHEHCLQIASTFMLHIIVYTQQSTIERDNLVTFLNCILPITKYGITTLLLSSKSAEDDLWLENTDKGEHFNENKELLQAIYRASLDLLGLCGLCKALLDAWNCGSVHSLSYIRKVPAWAILFNLLEMIEFHNMPKSVSTDISQRMKSFIFPSLVEDETIEENIKELISLISISNCTTPMSNSQNKSLLQSLSPMKLTLDQIDFDQNIENFKAKSATIKSISSSLNDDISSKESNNSEKSLLAISPNAHTPTKISIPSLFESSEKHTTKQLMAIPPPLKFNLVNPLSIDHQEIPPSETNKDFDVSSHLEGKPNISESPKYKHSQIFAESESFQNQDNNSINNNNTPLEIGNNSEPEERVSESRHRNYQNAASARLKRSRLNNLNQTIKRQSEASSYDGVDNNSSIDNFLSQSKYIASKDYEIDECSQSIDVNRSQASLSLFSPELSISIHHDQSECELDQVENSMSRTPTFKTSRLPPADPHITSESLSLDRETFLKPETVEYLDTLDLNPLSCPLQCYQRALRNFEKQDWPEVFPTINTIRQVAIHHPMIIVNSSSLHSLVVLMMKHVNNLRSSLAKNALLAIADLFIGLRRNMDSEVHTIVPGILKRAADSSIFLSESADKAIARMIECVSIQRSTPTLITALDTRSPTLRGKAANGLVILVDRRADELQGTRELEVIKGKLSKLLQDSSPDTRQSGRDIIKLLLGYNLTSFLEMDSYLPIDVIEKLNKDPYFQTNLQKTASKQSITSVSKAIDFEFTKSPKLVRGSSFNNRQIQSANKTMQTPPRQSRLRSSFSSPIADQDDLTVVSYRSTNLEEDSAILSLDGLASPKNDFNLASVSEISLPLSSAKPKRSQHSATAAKRMMDTHPDLLKWPTIISSITTSKNWSEKKDSMTNLTNLIINFHSVLKDVGKLDSSLDTLLDRLEDGSIKIVSHAMDCLERIFQEEMNSLTQKNALSIFAPKLLIVVSSSNKQLSSRATILLQKIFELLSPVEVMNYLSNSALYDQEKVRIASLRMILELLNSYSRDPDFINLIFKKQVFPSLCRIITGDLAKVEIRVSAIEILKSLQILSKPERIWQWTNNPKEQDEIKRFTSNI